MGKLLFDFEKMGDQVNDIFEDNSEKSNAACWNLRCKDSADGEDDIYFKLDVEMQQYCFGGLGRDASVKKHDENRCNPASKAKEVKGKCICPPPYTGTLCDKCESGFYAD